MNGIPTAEEWNEISLAAERSRTLDEERARWDATAPRYAKKRNRSGYLAQLTELLDLEPGESVLDMGCGPGVLSVPLAQAGHPVVAVDFSDGMLAELRSAVEKAQVGDRVRIFKRAWQEDWGDIPRADVAVSSRSMTTRDIADAVAKLESKAASRVVVTTEAGEVPWFDARVARALGREVAPATMAGGLVVLLNYLLASGRYPEVRYIVTPRVPQSDSADELRQFMATAAGVTPDEQPLFDAFFEEHVLPRPDGGVMMDYTQETRWACLCWRPVA